MSKYIDAFLTWLFGLFSLLVIAPIAWIVFKPYYVGLEIKEYGKDNNKERT